MWAGLNRGQLQTSCVLEERRALGGERESERARRTFGCEAVAERRRDQPEQQEPLEEKKRRGMSRGGWCPCFSPGLGPSTAPLAGPGADGAQLDSDSSAGARF